MAKLITIGQIVAPWGIKGELKVLPLTDFPQRFNILEKAFLANPTRQDINEVRVTAARFHKQFVLLQLKGITSRDAAEALRGFLLQVDEPFPLPPGHYYHFQIIGLRVETIQGEELGVVTDILTPGGNDVYVVRNVAGEELLIPALKREVLNIDLKRGVLRVKLLEGLR